jgi:hypothetical protein
MFPGLNDYAPVRIELLVSPNPQEIQHGIYAGTVSADAS